MVRDAKPDLSGAYGDQDDSLSWPAVFLVVLYSLTIGWMRLLAQYVWDWAKERRISSDGPQLRPVKTIHALPRR